MDRSSVHSCITNQYIFFRGCTYRVCQTYKTNWIDIQFVHMFIPNSSVVLHIPADTIVMTFPIEYTIEEVESACLTTLGLPSELYLNRRPVSYETSIED